MISRAPTACLALGILAAVPAGAQDRPAAEAIGTWVLACQPGASCTLRHRDVLGPFGADGATAGLEVQRRGDALVPVVTLRGLKPAAAIGGALMTTPTASVRFDGAAPITLACGLSGLSLACAPEAAGLAAAAAQLPSARSVALSLQISLPGLTLPPIERTLALSGTDQALKRFRATAANGEPGPASEGWDWRSLLDRGLADLMPWLAKLLGYRG